MIKLRWIHEKECAKEQSFSKTYFDMEMDDADKRVALRQVVKILLMVFRIFGDML